MNFYRTKFWPIAMLIPLAAQSAPPPPTPEELIKLSRVIVTAAPEEEPLTTVIETRVAAQPVPAQDGADYLKSVPGFSVIRKGGIDGDPVLRGQAGSRLGVLLDGQNILGGCGQRMDPPTAYVFPMAYDRIIVRKGPQAVLYGPGISAGVVLFERDDVYFEQPGAKLESSATAGSFDRYDGSVGARAGVPIGYVSGGATYSKQGDYRDGDGARVHSRYRRWSAQAAAGWTPAKSSFVELSAARSDGRAAYADRAMDGVRFSRDYLGVRAQKQSASALVEKIEAQAYYNYVDHVMDNFSLRPFAASMMMPGRAVSNPDRATMGGRVAANLKFTETTTAMLGVDGQHNRHTLRSSSNELADPYGGKARVKDAAFQNMGVFAEAVHRFGSNDRFVAGARVDRWRSEDRRSEIRVGSGSALNPTANQKRRETLGGGFLRWENGLVQVPATLYVGIGHAQRFPDYWELFGKETADGVSAFGTRSEKTTQIDAGVIVRNSAWTGSLSVFANDVTDFILIESSVRKPAGPMGTRAATIARNVDTRSWGGEAIVAWNVTGHWKADASVSYVRGENETDDCPLAQIPPFESRFGLSYTSGPWSLGSLLRFVAAQDRYALNQGNIAGQDIGPTGSFAIVSLNGGWRVRPNIHLTAGVDNVFDKTYAEFISRSGSDVGGYVRTTRVNEPGRTFWARARLEY